VGYYTGSQHCQSDPEGGGGRFVFLQTVVPLLFVMFEKDRVKVTVQIGAHYNQGKTIATTVK
jgi:hypothetical protein